MHVKRAAVSDMPWREKWYSEQAIEKCADIRNLSFSIACLRITFTNEYIDFSTHRCKSDSRNLSQNNRKYKFYLNTSFI